MNESNVRILSSVRLPFTVGDQNLVADFFVADDIPWLILGFSFLVRTVVVGSFAKVC